MMRMYEDSCTRGVGVEQQKLSLLLSSGRMYSCLRTTFRLDGRSTPHHVVSRRAPLLPPSYPPTPPLTPTPTPVPEKKSTY